MRRARRGAASGWVGVRWARRSRVMIQRFVVGVPFTANRLGTGQGPCRPDAGGHRCLKKVTRTLETDVASGKRRQTGGRCLSTGGMWPGRWRFMWPESSKKPTFSTKKRADQRWSAADGWGGVGGVNGRPEGGMDSRSCGLCPRPVLRPMRGWRARRGSEGWAGPARRLRPVQPAGRIRRPSASRGEGRSGRGAGPWMGGRGLSSGPLPSEVVEAWVVSIRAPVSSRVPFFRSSQ